MLKKFALAILLSISTSLVSQAASSTMQIKTNELYQWVTNTPDDGLIQILGPEDTRKFIVRVAKFHNGKPADPIVVACNAGNNNYERHEVAPGAFIICFPHLSDTISLYEDVKSFKNGSEGIYQYEPL